MICCLQSSSFKGTQTSILLRRFLVIRSLLPMMATASSPAPKMNNRVCSRNLSTILLTIMFSLISSFPGIRQQILLTINLTSTPAWLALYKRLIIYDSSRLFTLMRISAGRPFWAFFISSSICFSNSSMILNWETYNCLNSILPGEDFLFFFKWINSNCSSLHIFLSTVSNTWSV